MSAQQPVHGGVSTTVGGGGVFGKIAQGAWEILKNVGSTVIEEAPLIAGMIADDYNASRQRTGERFGSDITPAHFQEHIFPEVHRLNPYKMSPIANYPEPHLAENALASIPDFLAQTLPKLPAPKNPIVSAFGQSLAEVAYPPIRNFQEMAHTLTHFGKIRQTAHPAVYKQHHAEAQQQIKEFSDRQAYQRQKNADSRYLARRVRETIGAWRDQPSVADLQQLARANAQMPEQPVVQQSSQQVVQKIKPSALIRVGKLYGDWRDTVGKPLDSLTAETWTGSNLATTPQFDANSAKEMASVLTQLGAVQKLVITGHGDSEGFGQTLDNTGAVIEKYNLRDAFEPYITGKISPPREIYIFACNTASERYSIAWELSTFLKNTVITAPAGEVTSPWNITIKRFVKFKNGKITEN